MQSPLMLEALMTKLKEKKLPFWLQDEITHLYEITYREAFKEGVKSLTETDDEEDEL